MQHVKITRTQHPVGHGGFHSGLISIVEGRPDGIRTPSDRPIASFSYVYDCGSERSDAFNSELSLYRAASIGVTDVLFLFRISMPIIAMALIAFVPWHRHGNDCQPDAERAWRPRNYFALDEFGPKNHVSKPRQQVSQPIHTHHQAGSAQRSIFISGTTACGL